MYIHTYTHIYTHTRMHTRDFRISEPCILIIENMFVMLFLLKKKKNNSNGFTSGKKYLL